MKHYRRKTAGILDAVFFECLEKLDVQCLVECGANEATASIEVARKGRKAIAIEVNPETYHSITIKAKESGVTTLNVGLGSSNEKLQFYAPAQKKTDGGATFRPKTGKKYETIEVEVCPLDDIVSREVDQTQRYALWIDVEGFQKDVFDGALQTLSNKNCVAIKIEVEYEPIFKGQALCEEINERLSNYGYTPVFVDTEYDVQFNVVYIRRGNLDAVALTVQKGFVEHAQIKYSIREALSDMPPAAKLVKQIARRFGSLLIGKNGFNKISARIKGG